MVIGKAYPTFNFDLSTIKNLKEVDILATYFPIKKIPCIIRSPFRQDTHPSFSLYLHENKVKYYDFATKESGNLWKLLQEVWHCTYIEALNKVSYDCIQKSNLLTHPIKVQTLSTKQNKQSTDIKVKIRPWENYDINYWSSYGVSLQWLKYAEVYPISHKIITKINTETKEQLHYTFKADKYAYVFIEHKEDNTQLKIYQPFNTKGFKWCSKMDSSIISLWTKVPQFGDKIIICSSLKDALCIRTQLNIPTLALQGEGYNMSLTAIKELKRRYKKIFISFDTDEAGVKDSKSLVQKTGFINIIPDLGSCKDYSDFYKSLHNKEHFQSLKLLFN